MESVWSNGDVDDKVGTLEEETVISSASETWLPYWDGRERAPSMFDKRR